jgi:predicted DNA binding CopG/RHH family protein
MKTKASRRPFSDPFDEMSDEAFEREVLEALEQGTTKISLRVPNDLLGRTRQAAGRRGVPYQSLIKVLIDQGVSRLERVPARPKAGAIHRRTPGARRRGAKG